MIEIWKGIDGFGYEVSNIGRVRSIDRVVVTTNGQHRLYRRKILAQVTDEKGYRHVCLWKENRQFGFVVHRLVAAAFIRKIDADEEINHGDFDKANNAVGNLEIGTAQDNADHAARGGRMAKKLTDEIVRQIKFAFAWGETKANLARRFSVTHANIRAILLGNSWKHADLSAWMASHD